MSINCVIPCRAGSKRLKGKNKRMFCGKPLFCWTVELALSIEEIDKIIITTDDQDILLYSYEHYNDFDNIYIHERTKELAQDDTPTWKVIEDLFEHKIIDLDSVIILLQVTSPLRTIEDVEQGISMFIHNKLGVVSVIKKDDWTYIRDGNFFIDMYENWIKYGTADGQYLLMPKERSNDIDTLEDFQKAEKIMGEILDGKNDQ